MMKSVNLTEEVLIAMRPTVSNAAAAMFDSGASVEATQSTQSVTKERTSFDVQKDIIHYTEINEYLVSFLAQ